MEDLNRHISEDIQMAKRHMKRCSSLLISKKIHQKYNEVSPHVVRMAMMKKSTNNTCWRGCGEKGTLLHCWWTCKLVPPLWRTVWRFLKNFKIELPYDLAIPLLCIYPEKTIIWKIHAPQYSLQHYLQHPGHGSSLNVHQQRNG